MKYRLLALVVCVALVACTAAPVVEKKTEFIVVSPPEEYLQDARIEPPPSEQAYAALADDYRAQEALLVKWGIALMESLGDVNRRLKGIRESVDNAKKVYKEEPGK